MTRGNYILNFIRNKTNVLVLLLVACCGGNAVAQDPHFSQFFEAPLTRNPSLAGIFDGDIRVQSVVRSQWGTVSVPYQTGSLNGEYKCPIGKANDYITMGMQLLYDRAGTINFTTTNIMPVINYHKALSGDKTKYLSMGFMGGWVQRSIDRSLVTTNNQYDGYGYNPAMYDGEVFSRSKYSYWDAGVGMSFNSSIGDSRDNNYYVGIAYHHFNTPVNSFYKNPTIELHPKWVFSGGLKTTISEEAYVTILLDHSRQSTFNETVFGALYSRKVGAYYDNPNYIVHLGAFIRWNDSFIPVIKLDYNPFSVALSYDINISNLKTASQTVGAVELSVSYIGFLDRANSSKNAVMCPRF
ncbi:PorP/SprF family type IX secretion system membrane protein [Chitinophagaceae bacterium LWZ2-11]